MERLTSGEASKILLYPNGTEAMPGGKKHGS
jgi:hypothetical protein